MITPHVDNLDKCKYADQYKGEYPPRCNWGDPCRVCREKYAKRHQEMTDEIVSSR